MGDKITPTPVELTPEAAAAGQDPAAVSEPSRDELLAGVVEAPNEAPAAP